jgi:hypothetical protein
MTTLLLAHGLTQASQTGQTQAVQKSAFNRPDQKLPDVTFGADAPTEKLDAAKPASSQSFLEKAKGVIQGTVQLLKRVLGIFDGGYQGVSVLLHAKQWSSILSDANPERGLDEKTLAIVDLAYLAFRKGFYPNQSKEKLEESHAAQQSSAANFALSSQLLFQYPGLLKVYDKLPVGLKLIEDCISSHPAFNDEDKQSKLAQLTPGKFAGLTTQACTDVLKGLLLAEGPSAS